MPLSPIVAWPDPSPEHVLLHIAETIDGVVAAGGSIHTQDCADLSQLLRCQAHRLTLAQQLLDAEAGVVS